MFSKRNNKKFINFLLVTVAIAVAYCVGHMVGFEDAEDIYCRFDEDFEDDDEDEMIDKELDKELW